MFDIIIFKLSKYSYFSKKINISLKNNNNLSFSEIKKNIYDNYSNIINNNDIVLWIYAGDIINDNTDLTTIEYNICCYIITDIVNNNINNIRIPSFIYTEQLNQMLDMGFPNEEYIRDALILSEGRIDEAIIMYMSLNNN